MLTPINLRIRACMRECGWRGSGIATRALYVHDVTLHLNYHYIDYTKVQTNRQTDGVPHTLAMLRMLPSQTCVR